MARRERLVHGLMKAGRVTSYVSDRCRSALKAACTGGRRDGTRLALFWICLGLAGVLSILSEREIIAFSSDPSVAVNMALGYLEGISPPVYSPGIALFMKMVSHLGVPFRIAYTIVIYLSLLLCIGTAIGFSVSRQIRYFIASALAFFFSIDPVIVTHGDMTANSLFSGLLNIVFVCLFARGVVSGSVRSTTFLVAAIAATATMVVISRPDWQIVEITAIVFTAIGILVDRKRIRNYIFLGILSVLFMQLGDYCVKVFNERVYGVQGQANYLDKRYSDFFSTIVALPSTQPTDRYFLGDKPRRELAYRLSPTLSRMRATIENTTGNGAIAFDASLKFFGKNDIANAYYYWHIDNTFGMKPSEYFALLGKAAEEIQSAAHAQGIPLSYPIAGVLSRDVGLWIGHLPSSIARVYFLSFKEVPYVFQDKRDEDPDLIRKYDAATLRRASLIRHPEGNNIDYPIFRRIYHVLVKVVAWAIIPFSLFHLISMYYHKKMRIYDLLWIGMTVLFVVRIAYYALLDASFYTASPWYLVPNHLVWIVMLICNISAASHSVGQGRPRPTSQPAEEDISTAEPERLPHRAASSRSGLAPDARTALQAAPANEVEAGHLSDPVPAASS